MLQFPYSQVDAKFASLLELVAATTWNPYITYVCLWSFEAAVRALLTHQRV